MNKLTDEEIIKAKILKEIFEKLDRMNSLAHEKAVEEGCQAGFNEFVEGIRVLKLIYL